MHPFRILFFLLAVGMHPVANARTIKELHGFEPRFILPQGIDVVNIKTEFGAAGDGITDDTAAFRKAIEGDQPRRIYIPAGTYLVRDSLVYGLASGKKKRVLLIGECSSRSILKLADNSKGFDDPTKPKAFIQTRPPKQQGEQNMHQYLQHLTIEIGKGNPGAIALNYHSNNTGAIKDVVIRSSDPTGNPGHVGLACMDWEVGPADARYVTVDGFKTGIALSAIGNYFTLEHITVRNCSVGIAGGTFSLRDIRTENCETGIQNSGNLVVVDAVLQGNGANGIVKESKGWLLARNVKTEGHKFAISSHPNGGASISEFISEPVTSNWPLKPDAAKTLNLPVKESPEIQYPQSSADWTVIQGEGDITEPLQRAIDAGARHIYIAPGTMRITKTIHLRNKVERIMGLGPTPVIMKTGDAPAFRLEKGASATVLLEFIYVDYGSSKTLNFEHAAPRAWVIRHGGGAYETAPEGAGGTLFMESFVGSALCRRVDAWMRDMDTEEGGPTARNISNEGGRMWILGHKTEDFATKISSSRGAHTELLGGTYRQNWKKDRIEEAGFSMRELPPLFASDQSTISLSYTSWGPNQPYETLVREKRSGEVREFKRAQHGGSSPLFRGQP